MQGPKRRYKRRADARKFKFVAWIKVKRRGLRKCLIRESEYEINIFAYLMCLKKKNHMIDLKIYNKDGNNF